MADQLSFSPDMALVVVDVQHDFAHPEGSLFVTGAPAAIPHIVGLVTAAQAAGAPVIYTADWHPEDTAHFNQWPVHCVGGTPGADLMPELPPTTYPIIKKGIHGEDAYSGFTMSDPVTGKRSSTDLEAVLATTGVQELVIVGIATDVCVRATVQDAIAKGWPVTVVQDACAGVDEVNSRAALAEFASLGARVL
ncbi:cysteine hydrolase family protein [Stomatohabitans albus]|uniref:cysteine hydrolase family protein n=1 Tax=Stomatohabitans albus TaxID=3110766 RepID=UPI00300D1ABC